MSTAIWAGGQDGSGENNIGRPPFSQYVGGRAFQEVVGNSCRGPRQAETGAIKTVEAFEGELLVREEDTPSAKDICISISN